MATTRLKAGQKVKVISLSSRVPSSSSMKVGDTVTLQYYDPYTSTWTVSKGFASHGGFTRKNFDLPQSTTAKTSVSPITPSTEMVVDADFVKQAHAAACSEWKKKLEARFPSVLKAKPTSKKIRKDKRMGHDDIVATIEGTGFTDKEQIFIGEGLAPAGYGGNCLSLSWDSKFKFQTAEDGQSVILVPKES